MTRIAKAPSNRNIKNSENILNKTAPVKILKAVQKQSPLAAQKIKKAAVAIKQRKAFKKAGEPLKVSQEALVEDKVYELPLTIEEGTQEVDEPEFFDDMDSEDIFEEDYRIIIVCIILHILCDILRKAQFIAFRTLL